jgi:hypothetical protein
MARHNMHGRSNIIGLGSTRSHISDGHMDVKVRQKGSEHRSLQTARRLSWFIKFTHIPCICGHISTRVSERHVEKMVSNTQASPFLLVRLPAMDVLRIDLANHSSTQSCTYPYAHLPGIHQGNIIATDRLTCHRASVTARGSYYTVQLHKHKHKQPCPTSEWAYLFLARVAAGCTFLGRPTPDLTFVTN